MNEKELTGKVHASVYRQCEERGFAAPVDVLMDIGVLTREAYENWRFGKVPYLEKVCTINLHKLSSIIHQIRSYANSRGYKPSYTAYKRWGAKGKRELLRFSKSGSPEIEKAYATHYVNGNHSMKLEIQKDKENSEAR